MIKSFGFEKFINVFTVPLIIINFCEIWSIWLLISNFSVNHFGAICSCSIQLFAICFNIKNIQLGNYIVYTIGSIIIIFMAFVYNEIIILKFCDFYYYNY